MSNKGMLDMTMLAMESRTSVVVSTIGPESKVSHRDSVMPVRRCASYVGMQAMESQTSVVVSTIWPETKVSHRDGIFNMSSVRVTVSRVLDSTGKMLVHTAVELGASRVMESTGKMLVQMAVELGASRVMESTGKVASFAVVLLYNGLEFLNPGAFSY